MPSTRLPFFVAEPLDAAADRELRVDLVDQVLIQPVPFAVSAGTRVGVLAVPRSGCATYSSLSVRSRRNTTS